MQLAAAHGLKGEELPHADNRIEPAEPADHIRSARS